MKTTALWVSLFAALAVSPAFGNAINLFGNGWPDARSDWFINGNSSGGEWKLMEIRPYGDVISEGDFGLSGYEGNGHWASGDFASGSILYGREAFVTSGNLSNVFLNPKTDVLSAVFNGEVGPETFPSPISGTLFVHLNSNGTLGQVYISTSQYPTTSEVPEPGTMAMLGTGLLGIIGTVRRKVSL